MGAVTSMMERELLRILGRSQPLCPSCPSMALSNLDSQAYFLQAHFIKVPTAHGYATGTHDYINFCINHTLPRNLIPSTLAHYIAYTSQDIASAPKYLTGAQHFLADIYPNFDVNDGHPPVCSTIAGSKKTHANPIKRKLPLYVAHLEAFLQVTQTTGKYDDLLVVVILSCCFYICHDWKKIIK